MDASFAAAPPAEQRRDRLHADLDMWASELPMDHAHPTAAVWHREPVSQPRSEGLRRLFAAGWLAWRRESAYDAHDWVHDWRATNPKTGRVIGRKGLFLTTRALDEIHPEPMLSWSKGASANPAWLEWTRETAAPAPFLSPRVPGLYGDARWRGWEACATCTRAREWSRVFLELPSTLHLNPSCLPPNTLARVLRLAWLSGGRRTSEPRWDDLDDRLAPWADAAVKQGADLGCQIPVGMGTLSAWGLLSLLPLPKTRSFLPTAPASVWAERDPLGVPLAWRPEFSLSSKVLSESGLSLAGWRFELGKALTACVPERVLGLWEKAPYSEEDKRACLMRIPTGGQDRLALHVLSEVNWKQRGADTAAKSCVAVIRMLLSWGCDPTSVNERGQNPLHSLLQKNAWQVTGADREGVATRAAAEELTRSGTPWDVPDHQGQTVGDLLKQWSQMPLGHWIAPWLALRTQELLSEAVGVPQVRLSRPRM